MRHIQLAVSAWLLSLTACSGITKPEIIAASKPIIPIVEGRRLIIASRARLWKDPDSIRDATIGDSNSCNQPLILADGRLASAPGTCICLEANARNSYGGYTGIKRSLIFFPEDGELQLLEGGTKGYADYCSNLKPFPELSAIPPPRVH